MDGHAKRWFSANFCSFQLEKKTEIVRTKEMIKRNEKWKPHFPMLTSDVSNSFHKSSASLRPKLFMKAYTCKVLHTIQSVSLVQRTVLIWYCIIYFQLKRHERVNKVFNWLGCRTDSVFNKRLIEKNNQFVCLHGAFWARNLTFSKEYTARSRQTGVKALIQFHMSATDWSNGLEKRQYKYDLHIQGCSKGPELQIS